MKLFALTIVFASLVLFSGCEFRKSQVFSPENCSMEPNPGPCKAAFRKYYFDQGTQTCKEFTFGGCNVPVPFETLEDCQNSCE